MKALLIIWTDPGWHPTLVFTSQLLSEDGHSIEILGRRPSPNLAFTDQADFGANVRVRLAGHGVDGSRNKMDYLGFLSSAWRIVRRTQPDVIIGYDLYGFVAAYVARMAAPYAQLVYHNFDLPPARDLSLFFRLLKRLELAGARRADQIIFSSEGRASIFKAEARLKEQPLVVMNCQRLHSVQQKTGKLQHLLDKRELRFERLVVRLGSLGPDHGIEATIRSVPVWNSENWGLIFAGAASRSYIQEMQHLVEALHLEKQVVILPSVPFSLWYDCLYSADAGIALYEAGNINHASMAGAGNKLNLYLKAAIPSVVPNIPDFMDFAEQYGASVVADPSDPHSIASAVNTIFADPAQYDSYCSNAKYAFDTIFNFETQFEPVLDKLCNDRHRSEW